MKKATILFFVLVMFSCKKHDYRNDVIGSYTGQMIIYSTGAEPAYYTRTVDIEIDDKDDSNIIIAGDILGLSTPGADGYRTTHLNSDYTFTAGKFTNDSLLFSVQDYHNSMVAHYKLKKQ